MKLSKIIFILLFSCSSLIYCSGTEEHFDEMKKEIDNKISNFMHNRFEKLSKEEETLELIEAKCIHCVVSSLYESYRLLNADDLQLLREYAIKQINKKFDPYYKNRDSIIDQFNKMLRTAFSDWDEQNLKEDSPKDEYLKANLRKSSIKDLQHSLVHDFGMDPRDARNELLEAIR